MVSKRFTLIAALACTVACATDATTNDSTAASASVTAASGTTSQGGGATSTAGVGASGGGGGTGGQGASGGSGGQPAGVYKLVAIGDTGEGNADQHCVADAINMKCGLVGGCDSLLLAGDNFYDDGVENLTDPLWVEAFEKPYDRLHLNGLKFYLVLGNHDYGLTSMGNKQAQIDYSFLPVGMGPGTRLSDKWTMPASYYDVELSPGLFHIFGIDTQDTGSKQVNDMANRVANSTAKWKLVFAHHPRFTSGEHQVDNFFLDQSSKLTNPPGMFALQEAVYCPADIFLTGHDHNREFIDKGEDGSCPNTHFIISGAGAKVRSTMWPKIGNSLYYDEDIEGFFYLEISNGQILVESYDMDPKDCAGAGAKQPVFTKTITK